MGTRPLLLIVVVSILAAGVGAATGVFTEQPLSSSEPFAVWPVDTLPEAEEECVESEPWRTSPEMTVLQFARRIGIKGPIDVGGEIDGVEAGMQITGPQIPLVHSVSLRQAYGCWYVKHIINREDFSPPDITGYAGEPPDRELFLYLGPGEGTSGDDVTLGSFGSGFAEMVLDDIERSADRTLWTVPADDYLPGHLVISYLQSPNNSPSYPYATTLEPPPDPTDSVEVPKPSTIKSIFREDTSRDRCGRWWWRKGEPRRAFRYYLQVVKQEFEAKGRAEFTPLKKGDYIARFGKAELKADYWQPNGCNVLGRILPVEQTEEGVEKIRANRQGFFFDLEWGRADRAYLMYHFGENGGDTTVAPVSNPLSLPIGSYYERYPPGYYLVAFLEDHEVSSIHAGALPSLERLQEHAEK